MTQLYHHLRLRLSRAGLWPVSKLAMIACYLLGLDLLLFGLEKLFGLLKVSYGDSLGGWVEFSRLCRQCSFRASGVPLAKSENALAAA